MLYVNNIEHFFHLYTSRFSLRRNPAPTIHRQDGPVYSLPSASVHREQAPGIAR